MPRWNKWRLMPEVKIWEAVSLSLNIEPEKIRTDHNAWMGAAHPFDEGDEFNDRLSVLLADYDLENSFTHCTLGMGHPYLNGIRLNEFASWVLTVAEWVIPDELKSIAVKIAPSVTTCEPAPEVTMTDENNEEEIYFNGTCAENNINGRPINWRRWMSMRTWNAMQASRLMFGLDPDIFENILAKGPTKNDTTQKRQNAKDAESIAINHGMAEASPSDWLAWAKEHRFNVHKLFRLEVERGMQATAPAAGLDAVPTSPTTVPINGGDWKAKAEGSTPKPLQRQQFQEQEIMRVIKKLGYTATSLPVVEINGTAGVKSEVRNELTFTVKVFDKAWERLRADRKIKNR